MRLFGGIMIAVGLLFCLTVIGAIIGIPMMLIGLALVIAGGRNPTVVVQMNHHASPHHPQPQPQYHPQVPYPSQPNLAGHGGDPQAPPLLSAPPSNIDASGQSSSTGTSTS